MNEKLEKIRQDLASYKANLATQDGARPQTIWVDKYVDDVSCLLGLIDAKTEAPVKKDKR